MSNYCVINFNITVIPKKRYMLERAITDTDLHRWNDLIIESEGLPTFARLSEKEIFYLGFSSKEYYRNVYWEDVKELGLFLKDYVNKGEIELTDIDGDKWGVCFDGCGNVYDLEVRIIYKKGEKLNE